MQADQSSRTAKAIQKFIDTSKRKRQKSICFLTVCRVPGKHWPD